MKQLVIFDLDGTLTPTRPSSTAPFKQQLLSGVREKCVELRAAGCTLAIATNQGGARMGRVPRLSIEAIIKQLRWIEQELNIAQSKFATEGARKKPSPEMLLSLMWEFGVTSVETLFVGDADTDQQAAEAAGCEFQWAEEYFAE